MKTCINHPDRPARTREFCASCYQIDWRRRTGYNQTAGYLRWRHKKAAADPQFLRRMSLYQHHRMTLEDYEAMYEAQGGRCAICQVSQPVLHVDHDHRGSGRRGLLCGRCNRGIGMFDDDPEKLIAAAAYVRLTV